MQVPEWWLGVSGAFFIMSILLNIVLAGVAIGLYLKIGPMIKDLRDKTDKLNDKVVNITAKVEATVDKVHGTTTGIMDNAQNASNDLTKRISSLGTAFTAMVVAAKVINTVRDVVEHQTQANKSASTTTKQK